MNKKSTKTNKKKSEITRNPQKSENKIFKKIFKQFRKTS